MQGRRDRRVEAAMTTEEETFSLSRSTHGACEVVSLAGELDMVHAPTVVETLDALHKPVTRALAREALEGTEESGELFE